MFDIIATVENKAKGIVLKSIVATFATYEEAKNALKGYKERIFRSIKESYCIRGKYN